MVCLLPWRPSLFLSCLVSRQIFLQYRRQLLAKTKGREKKQLLDAPAKWIQEKAEKKLLVLVEEVS